MDLNEVLSIALKLTKFVIKLHTMKIAHRDINPKNIFFSNE